MLIAQISDLHCREAGAGVILGCDNNSNIALAIARLNGLSPRPDVVIATGDLTSAGRSDQYAALAALIEPLEIPLYLLPGNHDERRPLLHAFAGQYGLVDDGYDYVRTVNDDGPLRLVALDTSIAEHHHGVFPEDRAAWLDEVLGAAPEKPTLIFMHHPPFETGIWWMDRLGILDGLDRLTVVLGRHNQVVGMTAGHLHRTIHGTFAGVPVTVAPTTCYAVDLDINEEALPKVTDEPPAMMLHYWHAGTLISHTLFLDVHKTYDVSGLMKDWPGRLELMRQRRPIPKALGAIV
jgi:Icc protein